jgi:hypothetical protein
MVTGSTSGYVHVFHSSSNKASSRSLLNHKSLFQLWKTIFFLESIDNILIWGKIIHVQNYMHRKLYMFHTSTNNWFVRSKMGEAMLSTSSWKCCVRGGVGSMGREASGRRQVWHWDVKKYSLTYFLCPNTDVKSPNIDTETWRSIV